MKCSHGLPYESKCHSCVREALERVRTLPQHPPEKATAAQKADFWQSVYTRTPAHNESHAS